MKISFIVPVYNVADYLRQCIYSIVSQTYRDTEIILVNDGSSDKSPEICDSLAEEYECIQVVHKSNGGLSDARNYGLERAQGEYVIFVDSDDFWKSKNDLSELVNIARKYKECDFIGFNCQYYYPHTKRFVQWVPYSNTLAVPIDKNMAMETLVASGTFPMSACLKLIKRSFLINNRLTFQKGIRSEDIPWFIEVLEHAQCCLFFNRYIYCYRQNVKSSITNTVGEHSFNDLFDILKNELERLKVRTFSIKAKDALYSFLAYEFCILLAMVSNLPNVSIHRKELYRYQWLLKYTINPKVAKVSIVYRLLGIRITEFVLHCYDELRRRN